MIRFIDEHRNRFSIEFICKTLKNNRAGGFITSRGYRQSKARGLSARRLRDAVLVERALRMAHTLRGDVPDGLVFHADRGTQFTSEKLWEVCRNLGIAQSVGRTGVCFDNAMARLRHTSQSFSLVNCVPRSA